MGKVVKHDHFTVEGDIATSSLKDAVNKMLLGKAKWVKDVIFAIFGWDRGLPDES